MMNQLRLSTSYPLRAREDAAVAYAIHCQRDRRNITDADILRWTAELDKRMTKAEAGAMKGKLGPGEPSSGSPLRLPQK
jgi:hypothetical protein